MGTLLSFPTCPEPTVSLRSCLLALLAVLAGCTTRFPAPGPEPDEDPEPLGVRGVVGPEEEPDRDRPEDREHAGNKADHAEKLEGLLFHRSVPSFHARQQIALAVVGDAQGTLCVGSVSSTGSDLRIRGGVGETGR